MIGRVILRAEAHLERSFKLNFMWSCIFKGKSWNDYYEISQRIDGRRNLMRRKQSKMRKN